MKPLLLLLLLLAGCAAAGSQDGGDGDAGVRPAIHGVYGTFGGGASFH